MIFYLLIFLNLSASLFAASDSESSDDEDMLYLCPTPATSRVSLWDLSGQCPTPQTPATPAPYASEQDGNASIEVNDDELPNNILADHPRPEPIDQPPSKQSNTRSTFQQTAFAQLANRPTGQSVLPPVSQMQPPPALIVTAPLPQISTENLDALINKIMEKMHAPDPVTGQTLPYLKKDQAHELQVLRSLFGIAYGIGMCNVNNMNRYLPEKYEMPEGWKNMYVKNPKGISDDYVEAFLNAIGVTKNQLEEHQSKNSSGWNNHTQRNNSTYISAAWKVFIQQLKDDTNLYFRVVPSDDKDKQLQEPLGKSHADFEADKEAYKRMVHKILAQLGKVRFQEKPQHTQSTRVNPQPPTSCRPQVIIISGSDDGAGDGNPPGSLPFVTNLTPSITQKTTTESSSQSGAQNAQRNGSFLVPSIPVRPPVSQMQPPPALIVTAPLPQISTENLDALINKIMEKMHAPDPVTGQTLPYLKKDQAHELQVLRSLFGIAYGTGMCNVHNMNRYLPEEYAMAKGWTNMYMKNPKGISDAYVEAFLNAIGITEDDVEDNQSNYRSGWNNHTQRRNNSTYISAAWKVFIQQLKDGTNLYFRVVPSDDKDKQLQEPLRKSHADFEADKEASKHIIVRRLAQLGNVRFQEKPQDTQSTRVNPQPPTSCRPTVIIISDSDDGADKGTPPGSLPQISTENLDALINKIMEKMHAPDPQTGQTLPYLEDSQVHELQVLRSLFGIAYGTGMMSLHKSYAYLPKEYEMSKGWNNIYINNPKGISDAYVKAFLNAIGITNRQIEKNRFRSGFFTGRQHNNSTCITVAWKVFIQQLKDGTNLYFREVPSDDKDKQLQEPLAKSHADLQADKEAYKRMVHKILAQLGNVRFQEKPQATQSTRVNPQPRTSCRPQVIVISNSNGGAGNGNPPASRPFFTNLPPSITQKTATESSSQSGAQNAQGTGRQAALAAYEAHPTRGNFFTYYVESLREERSTEAQNDFDLKGILNKILHDELHAIVDLNEKSISLDNIDLQALIESDDPLVAVESVVNENRCFEAWRENSLSAIVNYYDALALQEKTEALASEAFVYTNALMEQANRFFTALLFLGMNYHNPMQKTGSIVQWN